MYLLDTNIVSELRKRKPHGGVVAWLEGVANDQIYISAVTLGELQAGIELTRRQDSARAREIELWLIEVASTHQVLPMDGEAFREWARLMHRRPRQILEDAMLAATARLHGLTLVTRNTRDFQGRGVPLLNPFAREP